MFLFQLGNMKFLRVGIFFLLFACNNNNGSQSVETFETVVNDSNSAFRSKVMGRWQLIGSKERINFEIRSTTVVHLDGAFEIPYSIYKHSLVQYNPDNTTDTMEIEMLNKDTLFVVNGNKKKQYFRY